MVIIQFELNSNLNWLVQIQCELELSIIWIRPGSKPSFSPSSLLIWLILFWKITTLLYNNTLRKGLAFHMGHPCWLEKHSYLKRERNIDFKLEKLPGINRNLWNLTFLFYHLLKNHIENLKRNFQVSILRLLYSLTLHQYYILIFIFKIEHEESWWCCCCRRWW